MVTIIQVTEFVQPLEPMQAKHGKYIGSFFSLESAEEKLGFFFVHHCCVIKPF